MKGASHTIVGLTTGVALTKVLEADPTSVIAITTIASLLPDIDEENSMINQLLIPIRMKHRNPIKVAMGLALIAIGYIFFQSVLMQFIGAIIVLSTLSAKIEYRFSLSEGFNKRTYHRTLFHHPLIGGLLFTVPLIAMDIHDDYKTSFLVGIVVCHYLMDSFTTYGLPFYPFKRVLRMPIHYHSRNTVAEIMVITVYITLVITATYPGLITVIMNR
jgi:hypothetical protein